ncbi:hypothetical protein J8273_1921 [Carpediemonas membranifera]|uniref:Chromo domain-containing protein n=1 Tax=Carpediemonas membranifera TaxID=201153 RepID=A0A8J6B9A4_9EUKA|nr:hypothetical protein J8273_1921 [Carpediemonas membranifera]|eukprot:KAG9396874.1 hypothetical protein J8273_1921 [Carpediemonas membranifera]
MDDEVYEIERIVRRRGTRGNYEYLVSWLGYNERSWVRPEDFTDETIINEFEKNLEVSKAPKEKLGVNVVPTDIFPDTLSKRIQPKAVNDEDACFYCLQGAITSEIVYCDSCDRGFCLACGGLDQSPGAEDEWVCPGCAHGHRACSAPWCGLSGPFSDTGGMHDHTGTVRRCSVPHCLCFMHTHCVEALVAYNIARKRPPPVIQADSFVCPGHVCVKCLKVVAKQDAPEAVTCVRCRSVWHKKCDPVNLLEDSLSLCLCELCAEKLPNGGRMAIKR